MRGLRLQLLQPGQTGPLGQLHGPATGLRPDHLGRVSSECVVQGEDVGAINVGGSILDAALLHLREGARVVLCGRISQVVADPPYGIRNLGQLLTRRARMQGFQVFRYHDRYEEARAWLAARHREGRLQQRLHILEGLDKAPTALGMLFRGENSGKLVCRAQRSLAQ